jgi:hypothetical protein
MSVKIIQKYDETSNIKGLYLYGSFSLDTFNNTSFILWRSVLFCILQKNHKSIQETNILKTIASEIMKMIHTSRDP